MVNTPLNVVKATLQEIVAAMDKGEITSKELVQVYLGMFPLLPWQITQLHSSFSRAASQF